MAKKKAEAAVARYPVGASAIVWVNPDLPYQAVLELGMGHYAKKDKLAFFIGVTFQSITSYCPALPYLIRRVL